MATTIHRSSRSAIALALAGACLCLFSCGKGAESAIDSTPTEHSARPPVRAADAKAAKQGEIHDAAGDLQAMYDQIGKDPHQEPHETTPKASAYTPEAPAPLARSVRSVQRPGRTIIGPTSGDVPAADLAANQPAKLPDSVPSAPSVPSSPISERSLSQKRADATTELAAQLKPDIGAVREPLRAAVPLIALDTIQPGAGAGDLDKLQGAVSPSEARAINGVRNLVRTLATDTSITPDPESVARTLREHADRLSGGMPAGGAGSLALGTVALCQRVDSFGRFTPLATTNFLAGRSAAAVVYAEIQNFAQRPTDGPDGPAWTVEVGQELQLILDSDGSRQWQQPESIVRDESRSKRGDYYLVQRIDLPKNLSVGKYTLKVIVRDKVSNAEAETNIPIQIVADASLLGPAGRGTRASR